MSITKSASFSRMSDREQKQLRIERLTALLRQANEIIIGLGSYVPSYDSNRKVMEEVVATNHVVLEEEQEALRMEELKTNHIITLS